MKTFLVLFFALIACAAHAQDHYIDSIKNILQSEENDTDKVNDLDNLCYYQIETYNAVGAMQYAKEAISLSDKTNFTRGRALAYLNMSLIYYIPRNYPEALKNFLIALKISKELGNPAVIAESYRQGGQIYYSMGNYPEALESYYQALGLFEKLNNKFSTGVTLHEIGLIYYFQTNYSEALRILRMSLKVREEIADSVGEGQSENVIGWIYLKQGKYSKAFNEHFRALKIFRQPNMPAWGLAMSYEGIGTDYEGQGDSSYLAGNKKFASKKFLTALRNYLVSLECDRKSHEEPDGLAQIYNAIGRIYIKLKKYQVAKKYLQKSLDISSSRRNKAKIMLSHQLLSTIDSTQGNFKQAYENFKLYVLYRDSIINEDSAKKSLQLKMQYDFDKRADSAKAAEDKKEAIAKAEIQNQKNIRNFSYTGAFVVFGFAGIGFYRYRRRRKLQSQQELLNEKLRISRELHDDIGSTLGSISIYSEVAKSRNEKNKNAEEALSKIGHTSRELIDKMSDIVWSLNPNNESFEELQNRMTAFSSMMLTPRNIVYEFSANEETKKLKLANGQRKDIFLIYKEAIYNIAKYAESKKVNILLKAENNIFRMVITDDGQGFDPLPFEEGRAKVYNGNGIKNMRARAEEMGAKLNIISTKNAGTSVELIAPI